LGRTHDGGGHEALHHIPGDDYRRQAARVTGRQWWDGARSIFNRRKPQGLGWGCGGFLDGNEPRVRNELVGSHLLLGGRCQFVMTDPYLIPMASKLDINVEIRPKSPDVNLVRLNDINLERHKKEACVISIFYSVGMPNATGCHY